MSNISLLGSTSLVVTPYVKVTIGNYTFGVFSKTEVQRDYVNAEIQYPNYIQSLQVKKINGKVNQYTLNISYPVTSNDDPNFFDKVFSSVSKTRKIVFSYGDMSLPSFIYKDEEAIITNIQQSINIQSAVIQYTIYAISNAFLGNMGAYDFGERYTKPSVVIEELLYNDYYGLLEVFTGMRDKELVKTNSLIPIDDAPVKINAKTNISPLDYLAYLVNCMRPIGTNTNSIQQGAVYVLNIVDTPTQISNTDTTGNFIFDGAYFKITRNDKYNDAFDTYAIDIGFPSQNIVTQFAIEQNENYALLYDFQGKINKAEYVEWFDNNGELQKVYAPVISSKNSSYRTQEDDKIWWTKVTEYPIKVTLTIKGLLRPAILMNYVRINTYFWGQKFNAGCGLFIITQQIDNVGLSGFTTTLSLTRVGGDNE